MLAVIEKVEDGYIARYDRSLKQAIEKVWAALTQNDMLRKWMPNLQVVDLGMVGKTYALQLSKALVEGAELAAVCCRERQMEWVKNNLPEQVKIFVDKDPFFNDSGVDAVMIATPHYSHPE